jgi:hypothetical protein
MNIINLLPKHYIEHDYFNKMFSYFDTNLFKSKIIYVSCDYKQLPSYGKEVIAILTAGDESGRPPVYADKIGFVFKHHLDSDSIGNVYHIPLPYCGGFNGDYSIPIEKRKYDVTFIGRNKKRMDMIDELNKLQSKRNDIKFLIYVTGDKFMGGWAIDKYADAMMNSKIVISPRGAIRAECVRFSEAVKCGCSIIACKHPNVTCFNECPAEYLNNWNELESGIDLILKTSELRIRHDRMKECWNKYFSPEAVGLYINRIIKNVK